MFTGMITNRGVLKKWKPAKEGGRLTIKVQKKYLRVKKGESIALNGCCLTVVGQREKELDFDISDETIRKTAFLNYQVGAKINLERAMRAQDAFGGHFVLGHVDTVGRVKAIKKNKGSLEYQVSYPKKFAALLIEKGSVTVDGISLTVCDLTSTSFKLYIIPHTLKETNMESYQKGTPVNLEFDVLGKYIQRQRQISTKVYS